MLAFHVDVLQLSVATDMQGCITRDSAEGQCSFTFVKKANVPWFVEVLKAKGRVFLSAFVMLVFRLKYFF